MNKLPPLPRRLTLALLTLGPLTACSSSCPSMYEGSNYSSAQSRKDGVFLRSYQISPPTPYLDIKEAFVEQRFMIGDKPLRLLDSTTIEANLIVVCSTPPNLGSLHFDWNCQLADGQPLGDPRFMMYCDEPGEKVFRFRLEARPTFNNPVFPMRLQLMRDSATNVVKTIDMVARPR